MDDQKSREDRIRERAHAIWEREGSEHGRHEDHWAEAERELDEEHGGGTAAVTAPSAPGVTTQSVQAETSAAPPPETLAASRKVAAR